MLFVFCLCTTSFGQETTGSIEGTVKDATGAVVPNVTLVVTTAKITATGTTTTGIGAGFKRTITTNDDGFFRIVQVPPGTYDVVTTASGGFGEARYENVTVAIGQNTQLEVTVKPGSTVTTVDVTASDAPPVDTTSNAIQTSINAQKIELIPKGTDFTGLLKTVPGTRPESRSGGFSIDGASGGENVFVIDGQEVTNFRTGTLNGNYSIPTQLVQEVQVKSSGFTAEFGGATGGVISVVTKGGNNQLHGELGMQFDTPKLDGNPPPFLQRFTNSLTGSNFVQTIDYFNPPKTRGVNTFPTANLSGPIVKNKLYFYGSYSPQIFLTQTTTNYYTNGIANRTLTATETYRNRRTYQYAFSRLDATPFDKLRLSATYLWSPIIDQGQIPTVNSSALVSVGAPNNTISFGGAPPSTNFGGSTGVLAGAQLTNRQGGRQNSNNVTGQADYTLSNNIIVTGRFSRGFLNEKLGNYSVPPGARIVCTVGSTTIPGACQTGFANVSSNTETARDISVRTNYELGVTAIFNAGGRHELKGGYQRFRILNDVAQGNTTKGQIAFTYGTDIAKAGAPVTPTAGNLGSGILSFTGTFGKAKNLNQSLYIQDKYQPINRLSLNLGVRFEKEDLPSFNGFAPPINFGWGDKVAPRLGFAYDIFGDGKTKVFGSYGKFYDRLKFNLPRGSFGGDISLQYFFEILPGDSYTSFTVDNILNGRSRFSRNLRVASNDPNASLYGSGGKVDPNLKPFQQTELTFGAERQISRDYVFRARYTYKNVDKVVEDAGIRNAQDSEAYIISNPGEGLHLQTLKDFGYTKFAIPQRRYDAAEFVVEKRLSSNWYFNANYTYSRLFGNYSGLVSSDEINQPAGRLAPATTRAFDLPFIGFTATGEKDNGRLETDRPHVFNVYGAYIFDWLKSKTNSTELSVFQTVTSGTPQTSRIFIVSTITPAIFLKRGDLGRSPVYSQTDFNVTHRYRFGRDGRFTIAGDLNILNLFNQKTVTGIYPVQNLSTSVITATNLRNYATSVGQTVPFTTLNDSTFVNPYVNGQLLTLINSYLSSNPAFKDARYGKPYLYQQPRGVRFGFRLLF